MLVSIIIITYNSSRFVLETLESAYRQTYKDIELIVSDDCSTDNTFAICQKWVKEHECRFVRTLCTQTVCNGGICNNYNHALKLAQGEWIKYIAGDDILCYNCIENLVKNICKDTFLYFCGVYHWNMYTNKVDILSSWLPNANYRRQLIIMLKRLHYVAGAGIFIERKHLNALGGFDTQFPLSEDVPLLFHYLANKLHIGIIDTPLVIWRKHDINTSDTNSLFWPSILSSYRYYTLHYCWRYGLIPHQYHYFVFFWIEDNYNSGGIKRILGYFFRFFDIIYWKRKVFPVSLISFRTLRTIPYSNKLIQNHEIDSK